jgi:hypothetical protein
MSTMYSTDPRSASLRPIVTGRFLAKNQWSEAKRARLAGRLFAGEIDIVRPTLRQLVALCRVPVSSIPRAKGNGHRNGHAPKPLPSLAEHFEAASPTEREEAARRIGIDVVWDSMIAPVIAEDRASAK